MDASERLRSPRVWLAAIALAGAALRLYPVWFGLPYLNARPDESASIVHALEVMRGDFNPHWFHWPSFAFYLFGAVLTVVSDVLGALRSGAVLGEGQQLVVARTCVALAGTATIAVLYQLARRIAGPWAGLAAAAFLAVSVLHVRESHFAMTDVLMTLLVTGSLLLLVRALDAMDARAGSEPSGTAESPPAAGPGSYVRWFAAAGFAGGLGASTKYSGAAIVAAMAAVQIAWVVRSPGRALRPGTWIPSLAFGAAFAAGFLAGTPFAVLDYRTFASDLRFDFTHLSGGHTVDLGRGWWYHLRRTLPYGVGLPACVAAVAGMAVMMRHYGLRAVAVIGFTLAFYASIGSGLVVFFRYALPLVPMVSLFAAVAVRHAGAWLGPRLRLPAGAATTALILLVAGLPLVNSVGFDRALARTDSRVVAADWLRTHVGPGEALHEAGGLYAALDLRGVQVHNWSFDVASESFTDAGGRTPDWLVFEESPLWTYASVAPALQWLANERYTLAYEVRATEGPAGVYDLQDAFFMPVSGFSGVLRPGPTVRIFRLKP